MNALEAWVEQLSPMILKLPGLLCIVIQDDRNALAWAVVTVTNKVVLIAPAATAESKST